MTQLGWRWDWAKSKFSLVDFISLAIWSLPYLNQILIVPEDLWIQSAEQVVAQVEFHKANQWAKREKL